MRSCAHSASMIRMVALTLTFFAGESLALGQQAVLVEEEWELVVRNPETNLVAPQITCAISPQNDLKGPHATFEINHQSSPFFAAGGMRLLAWNGVDQGGSASFGNSVVMNRENERITWKTSMSLSDGRLSFEVLDGTSDTWGAFGGNAGRLRATQLTNLADLNGYDPDVSISNSGVGYASNRVQSMTLKRVRVTMSDGSVVVDDTPRNVEL